MGRAISECTSTIGIFTSPLLQGRANTAGGLITVDCAVSQYTRVYHRPIGAVGKAPPSSKERRRLRGQYQYHKAYSAGIAKEFFS